MEAADTRSEANTYLSSFAVYCRICNPFQRWESGPRSCMLRCQSQVRAFYITRPLRGVTAGGILCVRQFALPLQKTALCQRTSSIVRYVRSCLLDDVPFNLLWSETAVLGCAGLSSHDACRLFQAGSFAWHNPQYAAECNRRGAPESTW